MLISLYNHTIAVCFSLKLFHLKGLIKEVFSLLFSRAQEEQAMDWRFWVYFFSRLLFLDLFFFPIIKAFISQMNHQARCKFLSNCAFKGFCLFPGCQKLSLLSISRWSFEYFSWRKRMFCTLMVAPFLQGSYCTYEKLKVNREN